MCLLVCESEKDIDIERTRDWEGGGGNEDRRGVREKRGKKEGKTERREIRRGSRSTER